MGGSHSCHQHATHLIQLFIKSFNAFSKICCRSLSTVLPNITDKFALLRFGTSNMRDLKRKQTKLLIRLSESIEALPGSIVQNS